MNPLDFPLLTDENIHPEVVKHLRGQGIDVESVAQAGLSGQSDLAILRYAHSTGRVILTQRFWNAFFCAKRTDNGHCLLATRPHSPQVYYSDGKFTGQASD